MKIIFCCHPKFWVKFTEMRRGKPEQTHRTEFCQQRAKYKDYKVCTCSSFVNCIGNQEDAHWNQENDPQEMSPEDELARQLRLPLMQRIYVERKQTPKACEAIGLEKRVE